MSPKHTEPTAKARKPRTKAAPRGVTSGTPKKKKGPTPTIIPGALE